MIKWTERYNNHRAEVGKLIGLAVNWPSDGTKGWVCYVNEMKLMARPTDLDEAKKLTIKAARSILNAALVILERG